MNKKTRTWEQVEMALSLTGFFLSELTFRNDLYIIPGSDSLYFFLARVAEFLREHRRSCRRRQRRLASRRTPDSPPPTPS